MINVKKILCLYLFISIFIIFFNSQFFDIFFLNSDFQILVGYLRYYYLKENCLFNVTLLQPEHIFTFSWFLPSQYTFKPLLETSISCKVTLCHFIMHCFPFLLFLFSCIYEYIFLGLNKYFVDHID